MCDILASAHRAQAPGETCSVVLIRAWIERSLKVGETESDWKCGGVPCAYGEWIAGKFPGKRNNEESQRRASDGADACYKHIGPNVVVALQR